jgi:hypothetical protein
VSPRKRPESSNEKAQPSREEVFAAMRRDADGMRGLQRYLVEIKDLDDAAFAEATEGSDRAELMELLDKLTQLLGELDQVTARLHPDVN